MLNARSKRRCGLALPTTRIYSSVTKVSIARNQESKYINKKRAQESSRWSWSTVELVSFPPRRVEYHTIYVSDRRSLRLIDFFLFPLPFFGVKTLSHDHLTVLDEETKVQHDPADTQNDIERHWVDFAVVLSSEPPSTGALPLDNSMETAVCRPRKCFNTCIGRPCLACEANQPSKWLTSRRRLGEEREHGRILAASDIVHYPTNTRPGRRPRPAECPRLPQYSCAGFTICH